MKDTDGSVIIEARIDTKQFDKDLNKINARLDELAAKAEKPYELDGVKVTGGWNLTDEEQQEYDELYAQLEAIKQKENERLEQQFRITREQEKQVLETKEQVSEQVKLLMNINQALSDLKIMESAKIMSNKDVADIERVKNDIRQMALEYKQLTGESVHIKGITDLKTELPKIDLHLGSIIKKVVKWGLAVFGVRSAYLAIRQAMSTLSQYDETLGANIQYIKYALAMSIKPLIDWIVDAVYKLLQYVNYIAQAWFGINLFANASVKNFNKANGAAKKLQKTLAGFDEMNVLNSNNDSGGGGGIPSFDLTRTDVPIPKWVQWIADHKDLILTVLGALAATFAAATIAKWVSNLGGLATALGFGATGILGLLSQIALIGAGIVITITIAKKIWDETAQLKKELEEYRKKHNEIFEERIEKITDMNELYGEQKKILGLGKDALEQSENIWNKIFGFSSDYLENAKLFVKDGNTIIDQAIEIWKANGKNAVEQEQIKDKIVEQIKYNMQVKKILEENGIETNEIMEWNDHLVQQYKNMGGEIDYAKDELGNINDIVIEDKNMTINIGANTNEAEKETDSWLKTLTRGLMDALNPAGLSFRIGQDLGKFFNAKGAIYYPPKLAAGGVINRPGKGIPLGSAIGGERGAEGVIPLTDSQQMELLGEAIGRYINVNLTNVTELDGRVIARKIDKVRSNDNFVMNR